MSVFVLLVFALKIGAAAACAGNDFADLGLGSGSGSEHAVATLEDRGVDDPSGGTPVDVAGDWDHANHHAIVPVVPLLAFGFDSPLATTVSGLSPNASQDSPLRPPIA